MTADRSRAAFRRRATGLLDQQLWCWGRDIVRPAGNILLDLGMCRHRPADSTRERSLYTGRVAGNAEVWLWGFGLLYCTPDRGGVFLRRYGFDPLLVEHPPEGPVFRPADVGPVTRPATAGGRRNLVELVRAAAGWMARYEHWVAEEFGTAYREATLAARDQPPVVPACDMALEWESVEKKASRVSDASTSATGPWAAMFGRLRRAPDPRLPARPWVVAHASSKYGLRPS
jgi:hypothetical protein